MVRRLFACEILRWQFSLRQCIRPLVELATPGHNGFRPLSSLLDVWPRRALAISGLESAGSTVCHLSSPPADLAGNHSLLIQTQQFGTMTGIRYVSFLQRTAHAILISLLANATMTTF
jgi:hypothetical protein